MSLQPEPPVVAGDLESVRTDLDRFSFTAESVVSLLGPERLPMPGSAEMAHFLHLTRDVAPLPVLVRLFLLAVPVEFEHVRAALGMSAIDAFERCGLVCSSDGVVAAACRLQPFRGMMIACDHPGARHREQIMGITESTMTLLDSGIRRHAGSVLDLGTGSGIVALTAGQYSDAVTATDISPRALAFAQFNAALNGLRNIEFAQGDAFEPVRGRRFGLVLCNPPFAISPGVRFTYRDSSMPNDEFCRHLVRAVPEHLEEGAFAQLMCNWVQTVGQDWTDRVRAWLEGTGCDAWVLRVETEAAAEYAAKWIRDTEYGDAAERRLLYDEWARYYEREGIEAISMGLIVLRRRSGPNCVRMDDSPEVIGAFGDDLCSAFAAHDFLERCSDDDFLDARLALHPFATLEQTLQPASRTWKVASARLRIGRGLCWTGNVDGHAAALLARCDGSRAVREIIADFAASFRADLDRALPGAVELLRAMVARGYVRPAGS